MNRQNCNTIYLVRHGENKANITHDFSYKLVDYPLTPKGILQAEQTRDFFADKHIDEIYTSPLKRAQETAAIIANGLHLSVSIVEDFREINVGSLEGRAPTEENWELHNVVVRDWVEGKYGAKFPDGEDYYTLLQRMRRGLATITHNKTGKRLVVVCHGGIITRTMRDICPTADMDALMHKENYNCSVTEIELQSTGEHIEGYLKMWASYAHLYGEAAQVVEGTSLAGKLPATKQI